MLTRRQTTRPRRSARRRLRWASTCLRIRPVRTAHGRRSAAARTRARPHRSAARLRAPVTATPGRSACTRRARARGRTIAHRITSAPDNNTEAHSSRRTGLVRQRAVDSVIQRQPADTAEFETPTERRIGNGECRANGAVSETRENPHSLCRLLPSQGVRPEAKTVTINVCIIVNRGWQKLLEARGCKHVVEEGSWIKTIVL